MYGAVWKLSAVFPSIKDAIYQRKHFYTGIKVFESIAPCLQIDPAVFGITCSVN